MSIPWNILKNSRPRAHLVAGVMQSGQPTDDVDLDKAYAGIELLVKKLKPAGIYAMMIVRGTVIREYTLLSSLRSKPKDLAAPSTRRLPGSMQDGRPSSHSC
jgi:hypothetical protein